MCGINGFNFRDEELIEKMNTKVVHRGPDGSGVLLFPKMSLGHRRLSIIDLSERASQPMTDASGRYSIIYNGELYNFKELKKELSSKYQFFSDSDTEVVLKSFMEWGSEALEKFNGIFAFAIWDNEKEELFLARDQFGVKPLYYFYKDEKFIFSSETKAILEYGKVKKELNINALNCYFRFLYCVGPDTMWTDIKKLPKAHFATLKNGELSIKQYYKLEENKREINGDLKHIVREEMADAVKRQMISDRPVGLFLSGGLDSSILCALMAKEMGKNLNTFSVGFESSMEQEKFNVDFEVAKKTAKHFGAEHHPIILSGKDVLENFEQCVIAMDEPVSNHIQVATYILARESKKQVAVVLGGDGGDETFGGYDRYYYMNLIYKLRKYLPLLKNKSFADFVFGIFGKKNLVEKFAYKKDIDLFFSFMSQKEKLLEKFLNKDFNNLSLCQKSYERFFFKSFNDRVNNNMKIDLDSWLVDESLIRTDKLTMAHGLEQRVPFLDKEIVELAFCISSKEKIDTRFQGKKILRDAFSDILPTFVLEQRKRGFFSPASKWLRGDLKNMVYEILSPEYTAKTDGMFDWNSVKFILDNHINYRDYALNTIWSILTFQVWARNNL